MADETPRWTANDQFDLAFQVARRAHAEQARKINQEPYIGHLLGVSSLIIEYGGCQDQAIAGLLHDILEDTPMDERTLSDLFGSKVKDLVVACTDETYAKKQKNKPIKKSDPARYRVLWRQRKARYIKNLKAKPSRDLSILVALADKVNNAEKTARDIALDPNFFENHFNADYDDQKWWYTSLEAAFASHRPGCSKKVRPLIDRFSIAVEQIFGENGNPAKKKGNT